MKKFALSTTSIAHTAIMTALVAVTTMVGITVGTGWVNMGDTMIFITATLFGPFPALIAGGIGSMIADLIVYPLTAFFTLFIKGFEGLIVGLLVKYLLPRFKGRKVVISMNAVFMLIGGIIMIAGYFMTQSLFWGNSETGKVAAALLQLPWDCLQAFVSIILATLAIYCLRLRELVAKRPHAKVDKTREITVEKNNFLLHESEGNTLTDSKKNTLADDKMTNTACKTDDANESVDSNDNADSTHNNDINNSK